MSEFFKLGEIGEFKYFTLPHFIPVLMMLLIIFLLYKYQDKIRDSKYEKNLRLILAFTLIIADMSYFWQKMYIGTDIKDHLPITICGWAAIFSAFMLLAESQLFFDITYFWVLAGSSNALITPAVIVDAGPARYRYYQFFVEHTGIFIAVFYMIFVRKFRPTWRSFRRAFIAMALMGVLAIYVNNNIEGANYLFLSTTENGDSVLNFLPTSLLYRIPIMASIIFVLFIIVYLPYLLRDLKLKKNTIMIENS